MAIATWIGGAAAGPGDISLLANWLGPKPGDGDTVHIGFQALNAMTANLDNYSALTWALLFIGEDAKFGIGDPGVGSGLHVDTITKLVQKGQAPIHIADGTVTEAIINSSIPLSNVAFEMLGGTIGRCVATKGRLQFGEVTWAGDDVLMLSYRDSPVGDVYVRMDGDTPVDIRQFGGTLEMLAGVGTTHYMEGGRVIVPIGNSGNLATLVMLGGRYVWDGSGTYTDVHLMKGILDCTGSTVVKTITNLYEHPDADFLHSPDVVTVTNTKDMTGAD